MARALSVDLRIRVLAAAAGATHREAGERFEVSAATVTGGAAGIHRACVRRVAETVGLVSSVLQVFAPRESSAHPCYATVME